jgi:hypothetical protein
MHAQDGAADLVVPAHVVHAVAGLLHSKHRFEQVSQMSLPPSKYPVIQSQVLTFKVRN